MQSAAQNTTVFVSDAVEGQLQYIMEEGDIPSIQVGILEQGELRYTKGFGEQTSLDNVFPIGSVQKLFVSMAILQLYEDGLIDLDADVNGYLPFTLTHPNYQNVSITPRLLLTHRSGLVREMRYTFCWDTKGIFYPEYKSTYNSDIVEMSLGEFLSNTFTPGGIGYSSSGIWVIEPDTGYEYSSVGYQILTYLVELASGDIFPDYVQDNILDPLNMTHTGFNASILDSHATPHIRYNGSNRAIPVWGGNYVLRSNVQDLSKFILVHMNQGNYGDVQILEPDTVEMMHDVASAYGGTPYGLNHIGYGMAIHSYDGDVFGHGGSTVGALTTVFFSPSGQNGLVFISNLNHVCGYNMGDVEFVNTYFNQIVEYLLKVASLAPPLTLLQIVQAVGICAFVLAISYNLNKWRKGKNRATLSETDVL